jgi:hypothetical protein
VLASLRAAYPDATIDWLVQDAFADAVRHHPALDSVIEFPRKALGASSKRGNLGPTLGWMNRTLRPRSAEGGRYDLVLDAQGLFRSGLFARWTGARRRVGYRNAEELGWLFLNESFRIARSRHAVDRMLALVAAAGVAPVRDMRLYTDPAARAWAEDQPWSSGRWALLAPTSRWAGKQWPADRFVALARRLLANGAGRVVIVGGSGERRPDRPPRRLGRERAPRDRPGGRNLHRTGHGGDRARVARGRQRFRGAAHGGGLRPPARRPLRPDARRARRALPTGRGCSPAPPARGPVRAQGRARRPPDDGPAHPQRSLGRLPRAPPRITA